MAFDLTLPPTAPLRWLYIDFNSYFASVEQQLQPELRGKPVAVVPVADTDSTCAIAASYEAKAFGVKTGTPIWEAKKLCKDIICVPARHEHYVDIHIRMKDEVNQHLPITATCSIDEVACRLMDNENDPEVIRQIALNIKAGLAKAVGEYVRCSIGVAPNKYLAKIATDLQKPDGLTILPIGDIAHRLVELQLRDLPGIGRNMEYRLLMRGIGTMSDLLALSPQQMRKAWGSVWGERMWYYLRGHDLEDPEHERSSIGHSHVLAPELRPAPEARHVARRLVLKAASRLRRIAYYTQTMHLSIRLENGQKFSAEEHFFRAQDNFTLLEVAHRLWRQVVPDDPKKAAQLRIKKVSVTFNNLQAEDAHVSDLIDDLQTDVKANRLRHETLSDAMDVLNQRYGRNTVLVGLTPQQGKSFSGTKVAFTRIPDREEFRE